MRLLYISPDDDSVQQGSYRPIPGQFRFDTDPSNPVRNFPVDPNEPNGPTKAVAVFHLPYYGELASRVAVQMNIKGQPTEHILADPPNNIRRPQDLAEWEDSLKDIIRMGGPPDSSATKRRPGQRAGGTFWAYDGSNLLGTPPRFYNQILRRIAIQKMPDNPTSERTNADFARLFALVNASMADAGILSWKTKWFYEYWRPETGVRETESGLADPFFLSLGAPDTNSNRISFKPPFPAYPSGHATFGGAAFQMMRLYYKQRDGLMFDDNAPDTIAFQMTSDELNGINRDLHQPYDRTKPTRNKEELYGRSAHETTVAFGKPFSTMLSVAFGSAFIGDSTPLRPKTSLFPRPTQRRNCMLQTRMEQQLISPWTRSDIKRWDRERTDQGSCSRLEECRWVSRLRRISSTLA